MKNIIIKCTILLTIVLFGVSPAFLLQGMRRHQSDHPKDCFNLDALSKVVSKKDLLSKDALKAGGLVESIIVSQPLESEEESSSEEESLSPAELISAEDDALKETVDEAAKELGDGLKKIITTCLNKMPSEESKLQENIALFLKVQRERSA